MSADLFEEYQRVEFMNYICGKDKKDYYRPAWNQLSAAQKMDYFVGYYSRKYKFDAGEDVYRELLTFFDEGQKNVDVELITI